MEVIMIVNPLIPYTSKLLEENINALTLKYNFIHVDIIGSSVLQKPIYSLKIGFGPKKVGYFSTFHANEWITTTLVMKFLEDICEAYSTNSNIAGYSAKSIFDIATIYIVPMVNPDGVDLVNGAIGVDTSIYQNCKHIASFFPSIPFADGWKANIRGVDLNLQFPAGWQNAKQIKYSQGFNRPAPRDFVGFGPLTEPEALAVYNFALAQNFDLILCYHTQGKEIYWQFENYAPQDAYNIGLELANLSGYTLANVPYTSSFAGYKDWFLLEYSKPAYTIEAGIGTNPLPLSQFAEIYNDNIGILVKTPTLI
jgi:g-D-glutamyl-meso-diaminopimelate peptidase